MATVTGDLGGQPISLDNAATENTLRELLAAVNRQTAILGRQRTGQTGAATGGPNAQQLQQATQAQNQNTQANTRNTQATNQNAAAATSSSKALDGLAKTAGVLGGIVGDLAASAFKTAGNLTDFAGSLMDGQGTLSGFYTALKDLPLGMGVVAGLFAKIAKMQEDELNTYRTLQTAGVNFGGSLTQIRQNSLELGLTMDQFAGVVTKNSEAMQLMGGTTNQGAQYFTKLNKELRTSPAGAELRALGLTAEQTANGMASYIKMTGGRTQDELKNTKAIAEAAAGYMKNLNTLSQLTGESAEQLQQKMAEEANEASFQAYLQTLDEDGRKKAMQGLQDALATGGKGGAQAFKDKIQGLPPMTEAGQAFVATMSRANKAQDEQIAAVKDSSKSLEDVKKAGDKSRVAMAEDTRAFGATTAAALSRNNDATGEMMRQGLKVQNQLNAAGVKNAEDETARRQKIEKEQKGLSASQAAAAAESEKALKDLGAQIYSALSPVIAELTPIINNLAQEMIGFAVENMPAIKEAISKVAVFVKEFAQNLLSEEGRNKIINDIAYYFQLMLVEVKKAILPKFMYNEEDAAKEKAKLEMSKESYDAKAKEAQLAKQESKLTEQIAKAQESKDKDKVAQLEAEREKIRKEKEAQKQTGDTTGKRVEEIKEADQTISGKGGALAGAATLGAAGALIGSIVPVVGTAIGGAIGAALGGLAGSMGMIDYGIKGSKVTDEEKEKYGKFKKEPLPDAGPNSSVGAAKGGIFEGPETGYGPIFLHGKEIVLPMDVLDKIKKDTLPDLQTSVSPAVSPKPIFDMDLELFTKQISKDKKSNDLDNATVNTLKEHFDKLNANLGLQKGPLNDLVKSTQESLKTNKDKTTSEEYKINGKPVSKDDFNKHLENNPKLAELKAMVDKQTVAGTPADPVKPTDLKPISENLQETLADKFKSIFPDFSSKLPSVGDLGTKLKDSIKEVTGVADVNKQLEEMKKSTSAVTPEELLAKNTEMKAANENLVKELQQLNKQTSEMVKYLRMNVDETRQTSSGIRSLSGNLFS